MITEVVPADRSSSLLSAGTISTLFRWSQNWYRPIPQVHPCQPVPFLHSICGHKSGTGRSLKFIPVGRYHFCVVQMVTELVLAACSSSSLSAGTISAYYRWSQKWYRPITQVHPCRPVVGPVPFLRNI